MIDLGTLHIHTGDFRRSMEVREFTLLTSPYGLVSFVGTGSPHVTLPSIIGAEVGNLSKVYLCRVRLYPYG